MVKFKTANGDVKNLNREQFYKLMKYLLKRAKLQRQEKVINNFYKKWN